MKSSGEQHTVADGSATADAPPARAAQAGGTQAQHATGRPSARDLTPADLAALMRRMAPTAEQAAVVAAPLVPLVVEAGAGSGKTETMAARVVWLVVTGRVRAEEVLGLTFTRKAAAELSSRIRERLTEARRSLLRAGIDPVDGHDGEAGPTVQTYHAYAAGLLTQHAVRAGVEPGSALLGDAGAWLLAHRLVMRHDGPLESLDMAPGTIVGHLLALAGELGEHLVDPVVLGERLRAANARVAALARTDGRPGRMRDVEGFLGRQQARVVLLDLVAAFVAEKRRLDLVDHSDQVALAARVAGAHPEVGAAERARFRVVLLDEYQDTSAAQDVLLRSLFCGGHPVTAVGDPTQAIYGWRGASSGAMQRFPLDYRTRAGEPAVRHRLSRSFRNDSAVLAVANDIASTLGRQGDSIDSGTGGRGTVRCSLHATASEEAAWIAEQAAGLLAEGTSAAEIAVLVRKRALMPTIADALRARGIPVVVADKGGLLSVPEVADVVAMLRVVHGEAGDVSLARLLTGPRHRLGPRDLAALGARARRLAAGPGGDRGGDEGDGDRPQVPDARQNVPPSLVEALTDPGATDRYSVAGLERLRSLADDVAALRSLWREPLADLVWHTATVLGVDTEVAAHPARPVDGPNAALHRLVEIATEFERTPEQRGLGAFLEYLDAAADRERGLAAPAPSQPPRGAVVVSTVHAAKGLEWDAVFVAGMTDRVFPEEGTARTWLTEPGSLPVAERGDASDLPAWDGDGATDQHELARQLREHNAAWQAHDLREERRLGYVAVTRARHTLACSGTWWSDGATRLRGPSELLLVARAHVGSDALCPWEDEPATGTDRPAPSRSATGPVWAGDGPTPPSAASWPQDPLGERREALEEAATLVRAAMAAVASGSPEPGPTPDDPWAVAVATALADLDQRRRDAARPVSVPMPSHLSVSDLVALRGDPDTLAVRVLRPVPQEPSDASRVGTAFHAWLQRHFEVAPPLTVELGPDDEWALDRVVGADWTRGAPEPGAGTRGALLAELQAAFLRSAFADRTPLAVEVPFDTVVDGIAVRGRIDAVFLQPDGTHLVVDWKTGAEPTGAAAQVAATQLLHYGAAWSQIAGVPRTSVGAAFHYVRSGRTVPVR